MLVFILGASLSHSASAAYQTAIPMAPEPVGSGARALGQSAFIAVADDATAASWNPAGLIHLEKPEASFVGIGKTVSGDPSLPYEAGTWSQGEINFMSYAQPFHVRNKDVVLSVNYHQVYDLGFKTSYTENDTYRTRHDLESKGAISAYSLAGGLSMPYLPKVTIGASFNWYAPSLLNGYVRQVNDSQSQSGTPSQETTETLDDLRGYNFTFGFLWDVYEREEKLLTLGFVCHTPLTARLNQSPVDTFYGRRDPNPWPLGRLSIDFPLSLGAGVDYRFSDRFSTALDVQWTDWSQFGYTNAPPTPSSDVLASRLGFERLWFSESSRGSVYALRGGVFYEPRPAWSDILPVYGASLGLGWTLKDRFSLDFAYQYRWGEGDDFTTNGVTYFDYGVEEHWLIGSVIVYF